MYDLPFPFTNSLQWVRFESAPWGLHLELKNREKIPGKGGAQPRVKIESLTLGPRGVTVMTVTPQRKLVSVGGMTVTYGRYFLAVSEVGGIHRFSGFERVVVASYKLGRAKIPHI